MKTIIKYRITAFLLISLLWCAGCGTEPEADVTAGTTEAETGLVTEAANELEKNADGYYMIDAAEAFSLMQDGSAVILDVRTREEYESGHISGALLLPNEEIGAEEPSELPDKDQLILVYCRSGNRSKQASRKLAALGYTNVYEFGGISGWPYETE